jgi:hypothetical protein
MGRKPPLFGKRLHEFQCERNLPFLQTTSFARMRLNFGVLISNGLLYFGANRRAAKDSAVGLFLQPDISAGRRGTRWKPLRFESASLS